MAEEWMMLKAGADTLARQRLGDLHQHIAETVEQFHEDAKQQIEDLKAPSHEGLGWEIFKALTDVLMVAFPEELIIEKLAGEAIKAFRDVMISEISKGEQEAATKTMEDAKSQLGWALNEIAASTRQGATTAWHSGAAAVPTSLDEFFRAHPEHDGYHFGDDAAWWEGWICDQIGIQDAAVANPSAEILHALWTSFHAEYYKTAAQVNWHDKDLYEQLEFLQKEVEEAQRDQFLHMMGVHNVAGWHKAMEIWAEPSSRFDPTINVTLWQLVQE